MISSLVLPDRLPEVDDAALLSPAADGGESNATSPSLSLVLLTGHGKVTLNTEARNVAVNRVDRKERWRGLK